MIPLTLLPSDGSSRVRRDRLELLTALLTAPNVEPLFRDDVIVLPPQHPTFAWQCMVQDCERTRRPGGTLCFTHIEQWGQAKETGTSMAEFRRSAQPLPQSWGQDPGLCLICPERPAHVRTTRLCVTHDQRWRKARRASASDFAAWATGQPAYTGFGRCRVTVCPHLADSAKGLCLPHRQRWRMEAESYEDDVQLRRWCAVTEPIVRVGVINLTGLPALVKAEIQWGLFAHTQIKGRSTWDLTGVQRLANHARQHRFTSLLELDTHGADGLTRKDLESMLRMICYEIVCGLRCVYYSPQDTKEAGFIETDHFGRRFNRTQSHFNLTSVSQRWLRDLLWDHLANRLSSTRCPRSRGPFDNMRRACAELSAFLEIDAPDGGHDPAQLRQEHAQRFVADQRHRARHGLPSIALAHRDGRPGTVTENTHRFVFNGVRKLLFDALESGTAGQLGLDPRFITAIPHGGDGTKRSRSPFSDEVARALADEANLQRFSQDYDLNGRGLRDVWEAIVVTGRRCGEILELRWDWHRPLSGPADALARPDQGRELQRGNPHSRGPL
ncbi:hypothetical protein [Nonomuraea sp. NPDC049784]|uniref:hypothetical protein n=1 Tax=Nonomuraea sp. NPDC049784 TaxID=3154361 RepID=UPI0033D86909